LSSSNTPASPAFFYPRGVEAALGLSDTRHSIAAALGFQQATAGL
jgi:hypothetical protein